MQSALRFGMVAVALTTLAACADTRASSTNPTLHKLGLTAGPLPQPKPFVVASRPATLPPTPFVYSEAPAHTDVTLTPDQQKALEASLAADAATPPPVMRRKKAPVNQRVSPLF